MKKHTKILFGVLAAFAMAFTTAFASVPVFAKEEDSGDDTFTVGFDQDFPPFGYVDENGDFVGFDIELATEAAKRMGKKIVLQPIDWDAKDMELEADTMYTVAHIRNTIDTTDAFYENEIRWLREAEARMIPVFKAWQEALAGSPFRGHFEAEYGAQLFRGPAVPEIPIALHRDLSLSQPVTMQIAQVEY